jgi:hypothetical protein
MYLNMPFNSFLFYVVFQWAQVIFVVAYGVRWYLKDKKEMGKN